MEPTNKEPGACDAGAHGDHPVPLIKSPESLPQAPSWKRAATDTLVILQARFPQCFARLNLSRRQPLKLGIHLDIIAVLPEVPVIDIRRALKFYVGDIRYLESCIEGRHRIDLDGKPAGAVTAEEAAHCAKSLDGIRAKWKRRKPQAAPASPAATPKKLSLADLKLAAARKRAGGAS